MSSDRFKVCLGFKQQEQDGRRSTGDTFRKQRSSLKSNAPLCSDDDWVSKCPSGCRLQGLISQMEADVDIKLQTVCKTAQMDEDAAEKSMSVMTDVYNSNRRVIVSRYISELKFVERADSLTRNLTSLRKRSTFLEQRLKDLNVQVQKQMEELYRAEVDVDMKLRTCGGTCRLALPISVHHHDYETLRSDLNLLDKTVRQKTKAAAPPPNVPQIQLEPVDVDLVPSVDYRTIPTVRRELLTQFEDIGLNRFVLELNGSAEGLNSAELDQKATTET